MAKKALQHVLELSIGKYVRGLDAESLNVAVWNGKIELNSLELDVAAVNSELDRKAAETPNLVLPFKVLSGKFQAFQVEVPWSQLTSQPVVLRARGLTIEVEPYDRLTQAGESVSSSKTKEQREQSIDDFNTYRKQEYEVKKLAMSDPNSVNQSTFSSRLVRRIIENIQVEISDVHISLQDNNGAAGVVLESLSLVTCDQDGRRTFVDRATADQGSMQQIFLYKMLQLKGFGIYLDELDYHNTAPPLGAVNENKISQNHVETSNPRHSYVLEPLSFQAKLRQAEGKVCIDYSKYQLSSELSTLSILLSRNQLDIARKISKEIPRSLPDGPKPLFPEYRPLSRVSKENAHEWWKYTLKCIGRMSGRSSWVEFMRAFRKRKAYIPLYKRRAHSSSCSWINKLSQEELVELLNVEHDRSISIEGLMTWRNVADAQVDKEREKKEAHQLTKAQPSYFSSIFGRKERPAENTTSEDAVDDDPPIQLTETEIRELELMNKESFADEAITKDSKLYDVNFVLKALKINLTSYNMRQLAVLDMGTVSIDFQATADGAYGFAFDLSDLEIMDRATISSLFPSVLRSIKNNDTESGAFNMQLSKTKTGDQTLQVKLAAFEAVASQVFFKELRKFVSVTPTAAARKNNPILAQSLSGSVDLFYDADSGKTNECVSALPSHTVAPAARTSYDFSGTLIDAWKEKTETEVSWVLDVDIKAPVIIIPESCNDPRASLLVLDLGNFELKYGKFSPKQKILEWYEENPTEHQSDSTYDSGSLTMSDLTFKVATVSSWRSTAGVMDTGPSYDDSAVIEPISVKLNFGVEQNPNPAEPPRICSMGVIPSISVRLSPSQGSKFFPVVGAWTSFVEDINDENIDTDDSLIHFDEKEPVLEKDSGDSGVDCEIVDDSINASSSLGKSDSDYQANFFFLLGLQRLSVTVSLDAKNRLEAHLVSVYASTLVRANKSSTTSIQMGWFWVLDMLQSPFPRRQRLLAHSNLLQPPDAFAEDEKYDMLEQLTEDRVFDEKYAGSTELADISYKNIVTGLDMDGSEDRVDSVLDAKFSSLFIHWNPHALKGVTTMIDKFTSVMNEYEDATTFILSAETAVQQRKPNNLLKAQNRDHKQPKGKLLIKAKMESLDIYLNSARDDYPLFVFTVSRADIDVLKYTQCMECSLSLDDVRMTTPPDMGRTLPIYRTLLGLAPGLSESLLTVKYYQGKEAVDSLNLDSTEDRNLEAFADVVLSPMRSAFILSQVLALVEYATEGILGVYFAYVASSAAEAAKEIATSIVGEKLFLIKATSFELILPQAAYREEIFTVNAGLLDVEYRMHPDEKGSEAKVALSDVSLKDRNGVLMQEEPIRLSVDVTIPSDQVGDMNDQAMIIDIDISEASFYLSRNQYAQILHMLDENFLVYELFLRDDENVTRDNALLEADESLDAFTKPTVDLTHAGVEVADYVRRKYINLKVKELAVQLFGSNLQDPLVRLAAIDTDVRLKQYYDHEKMVCLVSLHNLVCEDSREKASQRQYQHLVDQQSQSSSSGSDDLFVVEYTAGTDYARTDLRIGSPQVVLIPDAISELVYFFQVERRTYQVSTPTTKAEEREQQAIDVDSEDGDKALKIPFAPGSSDSSEKYTYIYSVKTKVCSIVLVDLGSQITGVKKGPHEIEKLQLTETVVLQGIFDSTLTMGCDPVSFEVEVADLQSQADSLEIFSAFGKDMLSPLQILEPSQAAVHGSMKSNEEGGTEIEIRSAATSPLEYSFSMHNAALLSAILDSLSESLTATSESNQDEVHIHELSKAEAERIENLVSALENGAKDTSIIHQNSIGSVNSNSSSLSVESLPSTSTRKAITSRKIQVKLTMPKARFTVINDLQGLDEALFRVSVINFVAGGELKMPLTKTTSQKTTVDFYLNTSILADYFDSSVNLWSKLLTMPWEITLKVTRSPSRRFRSDRLSSAIDVESCPCHISFSQEFLVSLASATRMWSIYSVATTKSSNPETISGDSEVGDHSLSIKNSMAASAARNLLTSLPYAIENHCGVDAVFSIPGGSLNHRPCPHGSVQYFRFQPPKGNGFGGQRLYGQDVAFEKAITLMLEDSVIEIPHIDAMLTCPTLAHNLPGNRILLTHVAIEGKTTVLHLTSNISLLNHTSIPFDVSVRTNGKREEIGMCVAHNEHKTNMALSTKDGVATKTSNSFSIPMNLLANFATEWKGSGQSSISLCLSPRYASDSPPVELFGNLDIAPSFHDFAKSGSKYQISRLDVTCKAADDMTRDHVDSFFLQVLIQSTLVDEKNVYVEVFLEPRAVIENMFPICLKVHTPMPHTFSSSRKESVSGNDVIYNLKPGNRIEIFTPGPSIAVTFKPGDTPIAGNPLDWMDGGWIDLPLVSEFKLLEPLACCFPFENSLDDMDILSGDRRDCEFFVAEGFGCLEQLSEIDEEETQKGTSSPKATSSNAIMDPSLTSPSMADPLRTFFVTVCCYGVDHTGDMLFEQVKMRKGLEHSMKKSLGKVSSRIEKHKTPHRPYGAFSSDGDWKRITLLPGSSSTVQLLQMTMDGDAGYRKSMPFLIEDLAIGEGGVDTTPILWKDKKCSGYFAYRKIINEHQSQVHIIPEFVVFNGSKDVVVVQERGIQEVIIEPGKSAQLKCESRRDGLFLSLSFVETEYRTKYIRVDQLGLKMEFVNSQSGARVGSVCVQTVIDTLGDARLVVKIGKVRAGSRSVGLPSHKSGLLSKDFVRFRVRWTEMKLLLNESREMVARKGYAASDVLTTLRQRSALEKKSKVAEPVEIVQQPIMSINLSRFTVDFQRVFKESGIGLSSPNMISPERSQLSVIIHSFQIKDMTPDSKYPIVFDCTTLDTSFLDLCIRTRGPLNADIVKVDLFDLKLAHAKGQPPSISIQTSEEYVWKFMDMVNRIVAASGEVGGYSLVLEEDKDHGGYIVKIKDNNATFGGLGESTYTPPKVDRLYDMVLTRVSPFNVLVSFRRTPEISRYQKAHNVRGAALTNYLTRRLKFSIEKAELRFARYENRNLKGPPDRLIESLGAVYTSRMKFKIVTLLSAATLQDWRYLAARDNGDDEYVEGDILRATGNLAGRGVGLVVKKVGQGIGEGVSDLTNLFGDGIEDAASKIGARKVGVGVNSVLSGVGDGVGTTVSGVGGGAGKVLKGAGQGIGHIVGGISGGVMQVGKGIGKGIAKGDSRAVIDGFGKGAAQIGGGIAQGAESTVMGAADGVLTAGKGLFKGVKNVGKGFGNAFTGGKKKKDASRK